MDADKVLAFCQRHPDIYYLWNKTIFVPFFLCHNPPVLCPSSKCFCLNTKQKMDQFSCFFLLNPFPPHPNIPPFRVVCHGNKSSQGAFRQSAVTHVTTGAKSEHSGQRDASMLEIYAGDLLWCISSEATAGPVLMSVLHL